MSEGESEAAAKRLAELTAALNAAQQEKTEAYLQADWQRVWELSNNEIPALEQEIAGLREANPELPSVAATPPHAATLPLDYESFLIELVERQHRILNKLLQPHRPRRGAKARVKVSVVFSEAQRAIAQAQLHDHVVFYECRRSRPVTVASLLAGPWLSAPMHEDDAEDTAENAREGLNDLRLIIQERAHPGSV